MFYQCSKWKLNLEGWDNTSVKINNIQGMFYRTASYYMGSFGVQFTDEGLITDFIGWDFNTNKTSLSNLFQGTCFDANFNANLDGHTATNITDFTNTFSYGFICEPTSVDNWILGNSPNINMSYTFAGKPFRSTERRGLDWRGTYGAPRVINGWDVSNVIEFNGCFDSAQFNTGPDDCKPIIGSWTICTDPTVNVSLSRMFRNSQFNDTLVNDVNKWDLSRVNNLFEMFGGSGGVRFNQSLSNWDTSNVTNMAQFVYYNGFFNQDISNFNMLNVTNINRMFDKTQAYSYGFDWMQIPLLTGNNERFQYQWKFDTQKYTDMLNAWGAYYYGLTTPPTNVTLGMNTIGYWGLTQYFTAGLNTLANGMTTREYMVTPTSSGGLGWTITDGGGI